MANFSSLKQAIQNYIKENGNKEITGNLLQEILLSMVVTMGDNAINGVLQSLSNEMISRENADGLLNQALTAEQQRAIAAETKSAVLDEETKTLVFKNAAGQELYHVSVASLIANGLVDVEVDGTNLVMTFHTESGDEEITIPIGAIFSPSNYYTKTQVDGLLQPLTSALNAVATKLSYGGLYQGVATPETEPSSHTGQKLFYIAMEAGEYHFLDGEQPIVIAQDGLYILAGGIEGNDWYLETIVTFTNNVQFNNAQLITSGGVFNWVNPIDEMLRRNYMLAGVAYTTTIPTEDTNVFYLAGQGGTYTHFLNGDEEPLVLPKGLTVIYRGVDDDGWNYWVVYADNDFINTNRTQALTSNQQTEAQNNMMAKSYAPAQFSGLGKKILAKNIQQVGGVDKNVMTQAFFEDGQGNPLTNTVFVIQYEYTLGGNITIPAGCTLQFDGGSISGQYTLTGNDTDIKNNFVRCFGNDVILVGTWKVDMWYAEWFGAKADGITDNTDIFNHIFEMFTNGFVLKLLKGIYIANQIDISQCKNITILGYSDCVIRLDPVYVTKEKSSVIRCTQDVDFIIQTEKYSNAWYRSEGITIKDVGLDGADKATTGIVCTFGTYLSCVTVSRCKGNGIETGYSAYPTFIEKCISERNGQHGFYAGPENEALTTAYWIKESEFILNKGYGMYIAQGSSCKFDTCLFQTNWQGGLKIKPKPATRWLLFLNFDSCYFEDNGLYEISDEKYDGNYTFCIEGDNTNPQLLAGKIEGVILHGCTFNQSPKVPDFQDSYKIVGTTDLRSTYNAIKVDPLYNNKVYYYANNIISNVGVGALADATYRYIIDTANSFVHCVKNGNVASYKIKIVYNKNLTPGEYYPGEYVWSGITGLKLYSFSDEEISVKITNTDNNTSETIQCKHVNDTINLGKLGEQLPEQGIIEASYTLILNGIS